MAKPHILTPIDPALSSKEPFENNLDKFINNETISDDEKFILLQNALRRVERRKPYPKRPLKKNTIDQAPTPESSKTLKTPKQEENLSKVSSSISLKMNMC